MLLENAPARTPVWVALSTLYLDTELLDDDYRHIAGVAHKAGLSWAEVERINQDEVAPVVVYNLFSIAGEWAGFDEESFVAAIISRRKLPTLLGSRRLWVRFIRWMLADSLERLRWFYTQ
jgi:hypothetical protein